MATTTSGITIEIDADASKFNKQMSQLRKETQEDQKELDALKKSLELDFDESKFEKAQKVCQEAIDETAERADALRQRLQYLEESGNVDTTEYQKLETQLAQCELQGQQLEKQLKEIQQIKYDDLAKSIKEVGDEFNTAGKYASAFSAAAAAAATALIAAGFTTVSTANDLQTLAAKYGTTAEAIEKLDYVALQTNVDSNYLYKALQKVQSELADLASGEVTSATEALQALGLEFDSFDGTEDQFYAIIEALASMDDETAMVSLATDIFGETLATQLMPMIRSGSEAIDQYCEEFETLGALTNEQIADLAEYQNALNKISTEFTNLKDQLGASLLPVLEEFAALLENKIIPFCQKLADWFSQLSDKTKTVITVVLLLVAVLGPLLLLTGKMITSISAIVKIIPKLSSALTSLASHPIIIVIAAIVVMLIVLYTQCEEFREAINALVGTLTSLLQPILEVISETLNQLMDLITPIIDLLGQILAQIINLVVDALQPVFSIIEMIMNILTPIINMILIPLEAILELLEIPLNIISELLAALDPILVMITDLINELMAALTPLFDLFNVFNAILEPFTSVVLIPIQIALQALEAPLQAIGDLVGWLTPLFTTMGNVISKVFGAVVDVINLVLGWVESAINFFIRAINKLINAINTAFGWLGIHINEIEEVSLKIDSSGLDDLNDLSEELGVEENAYENLETGGTTGDIYNNDYSTNSTVQNVYVTIENYAQDVDVDALIDEINRKLAEQM